MAEIKFHKAIALPSPLNSTHDGVWFLEGAKGAFKIYVVSGGVAVPLNYDDATGNYTAGEGIDITSAVISLKEATDSEIGGVKVRKMLQEDYDALPVKDGDTLYYIIDKTPDIIASYDIISNITLTTSGTFSPNLSPAIFPSIWNRTYDWDIVWRDGSGLHNLRDYSGEYIHKITGVSYSGGGINISWIRNPDGAGNLTIPAGAKLFLRLSDKAPIFEE